jgi:hypothetical protein
MQMLKEFFQRLSYIKNKMRNSLLNENLDKIL